MPVWLRPYQICEDVISMKPIVEAADFQAQSRLDMLKDRARRCVCKYCGGPLRLKRIIFSDYEDARVEIFCEGCDRIEFGTEPQIYRNARYFVDELHFNCYPDLDVNERSRQLNIAKVCEIMAWGDQNLGLLDECGFTVPVQTRAAIGECLIFTDDDLD